MGVSSLRIVGSCNRCMECCICYYYEVPDQKADVPPRKGWCPQLDLETKRCRIYEDRPEGCRLFPTLQDFERGAVPKTCGFTLVVTL